MTATKPKPESAATSAATRKYPAWKADKIRARLNNFRTVHATGEELLKMPPLLARMLDCPALADYPRTRTGALDLDDEWLRRFTAGTSGLIYERVDAVRAFLVHEGFLTEEELIEGDHGEMLALYGYLGNNGLDARQRLNGFPATLVLQSASAYGEETIELTLTKEGKGALFTVEEHRRSRDVVLSRNMGLKDLDRSRFRKGYAFFCTRMKLLHVFVRGGAPADRVNYAEVEPYIAPEGSTDVYLVRLGLPWRSSDPLTRPPTFRGGMLTTENCGIRKFEAIADAVALQ